MKNRMQIKHWKRALLWGAALLWLAACDGQETITPEATSPVPTTVAVATTDAPAMSTATPRAASGARPTATPPSALTPAVVVADQTLRDDGVLRISRVATAAPAWLAIHADEDGTVGRVLGYTAVAPGDNESVVVTIDPLAASETLHAILHADEGVVGEYEFPGVDAPVQSDEGTVSATFTVDIQAFLPSITIMNQDLGSDVVVRVQEVSATEPTWLIIQADADGAPGVVVGQHRLKAGRFDDVTLAIDRFQATPRLHATLYLDTGVDGRFEWPEADPPILLNGSPVTATFDVIMPPDILVYDQPVIDDTIVVDRVNSYGPGWLVIYNDNEGQIEFIVGHAYLESGLNESVRVPVVTSAVTDILYAVVHQDTGDIGEFEYPLADPQVRYANRLQPFAFTVTSGNYFIVRDQSVGEEGTVVVDKVVVDIPVWVVIHRDRNGVPGTVVGRVALPAGHHDDVVVSIATDDLTQTLHVVLHNNVEPLGTFDFPGVDRVLQHAGRNVTALFELLPAE